MPLNPCPLFVLLYLISSWRYNCFILNLFREESVFVNLCIPVIRVIIRWLFCLLFMVISNFDAHTIYYYYGSQRIYSYNLRFHRDTPPPLPPLPTPLHPVLLPPPPPLHFSLHSPDITINSPPLPSRPLLYLRPRLQKETVENHKVYWLV